MLYTTPFDPLDYIGRSDAMHLLREAARSLAEGEFRCARRMFALACVALAGKGRR